MIPDVPNDSLVEDASLEPIAEPVLTVAQHPLPQKDATPPMDPVPPPNTILPPGPSPETAHPPDAVDSSRAVPEASLPLTMILPLPESVDPAPHTAQPPDTVDSPPVAPEASVPMDTADTVPADTASPHTVPPPATVPPQSEPAASDPSRQQVSQPIPTAPPLPIWSWNDNSCTVDSILAILYTPYLQWDILPDRLPSAAAQLFYVWSHQHPDWFVNSSVQMTRIRNSVRSSITAEHRIQFSLTTPITDVIRALVPREWTSFEHIYEGVCSDCGSSELKVGRVFEYELRNQFQSLGGAGTTQQMLDLLVSCIHELILTLGRLTVVLNRRTSAGRSRPVTGADIAGM